MPADSLPFLQGWIDDEYMERMHGQETSHFTLTTLELVMISQAFDLASHEAIEADEQTVVLPGWVRLSLKQLVDELMPICRRWGQDNEVTMLMDILQELPRAMKVRFWCPFIRPG